MIVELVILNRPEGMDREAALADARATVGRWRANEALARKLYLLGEDEMAGLYFWPDRDSAERAHDAEWRAQAKARTGAEPVIRYFEPMLLLDNEKDVLADWPGREIL